MQVWIVLEKTMMLQCLLRKKHHLAKASLFLCARSNCRFQSTTKTNHSAYLTSLIVTSFQTTKCAKDRFWIYPRYDNEIIFIFLKLNAVNELSKIQNSSLPTPIRKSFKINTTVFLVSFWVSFFHQILAK